MMPARSTGRGFTLLEVLVVVAIGAIVAALVVLRLGDLRSPQAPGPQLERLAGLIEAQCQQALFQSRPRGVRITAGGYDFWQAAADGWAALPDDGINRQRQWLGRPDIELVVEGHPVRVEDESDAPQLVCQPVGELSPFTLVMRVAGEQFRLTGEPGGRLAMERRP